MKNKTIGVMLAGDLEFSLTPVIDYFNIEEWIAVDGGYDHLLKANIKPKIVIGDFDSTTQTIPANNLRYHPIKDDTDFNLAIEYIEKHYREQTKIIVCGVIAQERIEHFIANLKVMTRQMIYVLPHNLIYQLEPGTHEIEPRGDKFSLFAKKTVADLTIKNAKWELKNYHLDINDPLTISNEFSNKNLEISFSTGIIQLYLENTIF